MLTQEAVLKGHCPWAVLVLAGASSALGAPPSAPLAPVIELSALDGSTGFVMNGADPADRSGASISSIGDVNGDGIDDLIVGAYLASNGTRDQAGESYVIFGDPGLGASGSIELSTLDGTVGFALFGPAYSRSGSSVAGVGDINDDGIDDIIIGAPTATPGGRQQAGVSYIVFGSPTIGSGGSIDLSALDGLDGFAINGIEVGDAAGSSVSAAGDVNGDGVGDIIIGAPNATPDGLASAGATYVVFGGSSVGAGGSFELSALNGTNGFVVNGTSAFDDSGERVSRAGDVNGDGADDILISASDASPNGKFHAGTTYVVLGGPGVGASGTMALSSLNGANGFVINGIDPSDGSGHSVACAGDINTDGFDDILIGAPFADPSGLLIAGETYIVLGGPSVGASGAIELSSLDGTNGFVILGADQGDLSGVAVSGVGDANGDGVDDLIIGALAASPGQRTSAGQSYLVLGSPGIGAAGSLDLSSSPDTFGVVINGIDPTDESGAAVSGAGDVNDDGFEDLLIGARRANPDGRSDAGESYVIFGGPVRAPNVCPADINGDGYTSVADFVILAANFGASVTPGTLGDLTGEGGVNAGDFVVLAADFGCQP